MSLRRAGDRWLQLSILNEEFLVSASHQLALITSLPFVHTARRYYRLTGLARTLDWSPGGRQRSPGILRETVPAWSVRGSKSRNKVSVGEPAEGSLMFPFRLIAFHLFCPQCVCVTNRVSECFCALGGCARRFSGWPCTIVFVGFFFLEGVCPFFRVYKFATEKNNFQRWIPWLARR